MENIESFFDYRDGKLLWNQDIGNNVKAGDRAGSLHSTGYRHITLNGKRYMEHRIIFLMHNPDWNISDRYQQIDHINMIKDDNRIENLRVVTNQENQFNRNDKGYCWSKRNKKFVAQIMIDGKLKYLGYFDYATDARLAYLEAKKRIHLIVAR